MREPRYGGNISLFFAFLSSLFIFVLLLSGISRNSWFLPAGFRKHTHNAKSRKLLLDICDVNQTCMRTKNNICNTDTKNNLLCPYEEIPAQIRCIIFHITKKPKLFSSPSPESGRSGCREVGPLQGLALAAQKGSGGVWVEIGCRSKVRRSERTCHRRPAFEGIGSVEPRRRGGRDKGGGDRVGGKRARSFFLFFSRETLARV